MIHLQGKRAFLELIGCLLMVVRLDCQFDEIVETVTPASNDAVGLGSHHGVAVATGSDGRDQ